MALVVALVGDIIVLANGCNGRSIGFVTMSAHVIIVCLVVHICDHMGDSRRGSIRTIVARSCAIIVVGAGIVHDTFQIVAFTMDHGIIVTLPRSAGLSNGSYLVGIKVTDLIIVLVGQVPMVAIFVDQDFAIMRSTLANAGSEKRCFKRNPPSEVMPRLSILTARFADSITIVTIIAPSAGTLLLTKRGIHDERLLVVVVVVGSMASYRDPIQARFDYG